MSPLRVHHYLETWRAAERARNGFDQEMPEYAAAEVVVVESREAYVDAVRVLAEARGTAGIDAMSAVMQPSPGTGGPNGQTRKVRQAASILLAAATDDQRASESDQVVSDADQRESDGDIIAAHAAGRRPAGDTQARSSLRRLASSATRDKNADARDANADERDTVIESLDVAQP